MENLPTPTEIRTGLDEYVIGQDDAKRVLSVAVYNHYKRVFLNTSDSGVELKKSNVLMIGPTGSGKTLLASTLAKILGVPFAMGDTTAFLATGVGKEVEKFLLELIQSAGGDIKKAERGIVFIDEIDKLSKRDYNRGAGEGIQQQLLKIVEGTVTNVPLGGTLQKIDTSGILFIVAGAFVGLDVIAQERISIKIADLRKASDFLKEVSPEDLTKFGLIPEFIGRIPIVVILEALDHSALIDALTKPKNAIVTQFKKMFALDHVELVFLEESLRAVADRAIELGTGARALRTIVEDALLDTMYNTPGEKTLNRVTVTADTIKKTGKPIFEYIESKEEVELVPLPVKPARNPSGFAD